MCYRYRRSYWPPIKAAVCKDCFKSRTKNVAYSAYRALRADAGAELAGAGA